MTLIGLLFVSYSSRGHQLVFSYPAGAADGRPPPPHLLPPPAELLLPLSAEASPSAAASLFPAAPSAPSAPSAPAAAQSQAPSTATSAASTPRRPARPRGNSNASTTTTVNAAYGLAQSSAASASASAATATSSAATSASVKARAAATATASASATSQFPAPRPASYAGSSSAAPVYGLAPADASLPASNPSGSGDPSAAAAAAKPKAAASSSAAGGSANASSTVSRHGSLASMAQLPRETFLGFDCTFLSDILSPKVSLCDKPFHLTVDNVDFVGLPTLLNADRPGTGLRFARLVQRRKLMKAGNARQDPNQLEMSPVHPHQNTFFSPSTIANSPALPLATPSQQHSKQQPQQQQQQQDTSTSNYHHQLTMFNIVFAMQPDGRGATHHGNEINSIYEQLRRGYVRKETELILAIKDEWLASNRGGDSSRSADAGIPNASAGSSGSMMGGVRGTADSGQAHRKGNPKTQSHAHLDLMALQSRLLQASSLARCLARIYHTVLGQTSPHFEINDSVSLALRISDLEPEFAPSLCVPETLSTGPDPLQMQPTSSINPEGQPYPILRPYQALLLLSDPEEILKTLPVDASPLLVELIQVVTPTQSFHDLQSTLSCSLAQIYRLAAHLYFWRKARIIHVISNRNVYVVSPTAHLSNMSALSAEFSQRFPQLVLAQFLQALSTPRPYHEIIPKRESRNYLFLEVITFLLRKSLVVQLHMYIYLIVPASICGAGAQTRSVSSPSPGSEVSPIDAYDGYGWQHPHQNHHYHQYQYREDGDVPAVGPTMIRDLSNPTPQEREWIAAMAGTQPQLAELFTRMVPYFNGRYHVEEILYLESISRKELKMIIKEYRDAIVTTFYPDHQLV
ncbi:nitrogen permease regulator of amino acid transport activity 3-domain-containing protein [Entophlyctis helioformis]|nr:nitrogen permease regulator of amino acid transport activity 3-domain-containing protein [Entophlyctis helioformis]